MKYSFQFGSYDRHPKNEKSYEYNFPEDILFFTGGEREIGHCKHDGAVHILGITRASDEELENIHFDWAADIVTVANGSFKYETFRVNGYAFITLHNCIPCKELHFTDAKKINEILDLKNHPVYVIKRTDQDVIANIIRIDYIKSEFNVNTQIVQLNAELTGYSAPIIYSDRNLELKNIVHPFYKFSAYVLDEKYGKELFDEIFYTNLSSIYPEYKEKLIGYDLEYLPRTSKEFFEEFNDGCLIEHMIDEDFNKRVKDFEVFRKFEGKLPLKNEKA